MNISRSIRRLTNIFLALFVGLSAGLVYWQVVVAQQVTSNAYLTYSRQCTTETSPLRGNIYDRNGVLLAYSVKSDIIGLCGYKRVYTDAAKGLEGLIGYFISPLYTATGIESAYNNYLSGSEGVTALDNTVNSVLHVPPQGDNIYLTVDSRVEKILLKNFSLEAPIDNVNTYQTDRGSVIASDPKTGEVLGIISQPGYDANCVVNCSMNLLYTDMLASGYNKTIACPGSCSLSDFKTALDKQTTLQKQSLSSQCEDDNDCNLIYLNYLNSDPEQPLIFRPTQDCYPPGSTYKTMTLEAALDSGALGLNNNVFYNDPKVNPYPKHLQAIGPITVGSNGEAETLPNNISNIDGYTFHFPVSLAYGFSHSDNIIFAEAGIATGVDNWLKYNYSLYINRKIPFDNLPVKVSTVAYSYKNQSSLCTYNQQKDVPITIPDLAENSFGQGTDFVTPLQMMLINNVAADDGKLMQPAIIQKIIDPKTKTVLKSFSATQLSQPISAASAQGVRDAMYGVNQCGSGSLNLVQLSYGYTPWSVIGKTGTAQVPEQATKNVGGDSWYVTQAPYVYQSNTIPALTITAMKENGGEGAYANGPMLNQDYGQIFSTVLTNVPKPSPPPGGYNFCYQTGFLQAK